jgi:hypothetical protein
MDSIVLQVNLVPEVVRQTTAVDSSGNTSTPSTFYARVYGVNHNVLRIADGFGGVLFTI